MDRALLTVVFNHRKGISPQEGAGRVEAFYGANTTATFDILAIIKALSERKGEAQCSNEWSKEDCFVECRYNDIKTLCNCSAPMFATVLPALEVINFIYYVGAINVAQRTKRRRSFSFSVCIYITKN